MKTEKNLTTDGSEALVPAKLELHRETIKNLKAQTGVRAGLRNQSLGACNTRTCAPTYQINCGYTSGC